MAVSINLKTTKPPSTTAHTLTNADQANAVQVHRDCGEVTIQFKANDGEVSYTGVHGTDLADASHDQAAGAIASWPIYQHKGPNPADPSLFVQSSVGATVVVITQQARPTVYAE